MSRRSSWHVASLLLLAAFFTCGAAPTDGTPPKLPPCPRPSGSVYRPGEAAAPATGATATPPAPAESAASDVVATAKAPAPPPSFARKSYAPSPRPPMPTSAVAACGDKKTPCPLQRWMREKMAPALAANDGAALGAALDRVAKVSPDATWQWKAISETAAAAAKQGDVTEARKSCQGCHTAFKAPYKQKFRTRAAP